MTFLEAAFLAQQNDKRFRKVGWSGWLKFADDERLYWCDEYENATISVNGYGDGTEQLNYHDLNSEWEVEK